MGFIVRFPVLLLPHVLSLLSPFPRLSSQSPTCLSQYLLSHPTSNTSPPSVRQSNTSSSHACPLCLFLSCPSPSLCPIPLPASLPPISGSSSTMLINTPLHNTRPGPTRVYNSLVIFPVRRNSSPSPSPAHRHPYYLHRLSQLFGLQGRFSIFDTRSFLC